MNRASIGATSFDGRRSAARFRGQAPRVGEQSRWTAAGSSTVSFTGLSSAMAPSLSFAIFFSPLYGSSTRSRLTITRTGKPGRIVRVGWMLRLRRTTCCPVWFRESLRPRRSA